MNNDSFKKMVIGEVRNEPSPENYSVQSASRSLNVTSTSGDINGDGFDDIVISGRQGQMVWFENTGKNKPWPKHIIDDNVEKIECGGIAYDITGNGCADVINGSNGQNDELFWWENPCNNDMKWEKRLIVKTGYRQFHDIAVGDITGSGEKHLVFTNQGGKNGTVIYYIPFPEDPKISPWPGLKIIASGKSEQRSDDSKILQPEEGLAIGDIDGDGKNEVVCGTHWYKYSDGKWNEYKFTSGYIATKTSLGDIDGDGINEIILSEGDPLIYGKPEGGKLAWFKPGKDIYGRWNENIIDDYLLDAHTLDAGNICGNKMIDILVGEIGRGDNTRDCYIGKKPQIIVYENKGGGVFKKNIIDNKTGIHDGFLLDSLNRGKSDIAGKPLNGPERWNVHIWYNEI